MKIVHLNEISDGKGVAVQCTWSGTHLGPIYTANGTRIEPTGKKVDGALFCEVYTFRGDQVCLVVNYQEPASWQAQILDKPAAAPAAPEAMLRLQSALHLGEDLPDFTMDSTHGRINLNQYLGSHWGVLFSHPADFTPICTTELSLAEKYLPEFEKRNVKLLGLSVDPVESHIEWAKDIAAYDPSLKLTADKGLSFPIVADPYRELSIRLGMLDPEKKDLKGIPQSCRAVFFIGPDKKLKASVLYPASTGRNFDELIRVIDSLQLAPKKVGTPGNWVQGDDCIVQSSVPAEDIGKLFPGARLVELPSGKKYIRFVKQPV